MSKIYAKISAIGGYVPDYVLTNAELEKMVETSDEWIVSRTGIRERRILREEGQATSDMAVKAIQELFAKSGVTPDEIDLVICSTVTPDLVFPATANIISDKAGIKNAFSYDLNAACSGFIYALYTGAMFIESGKYKKVLVIGADKMSSIVDYQDRATCVIFGDGAGVVLLEPTTEKIGLIDSVMQSDGSGRHFLHQKAGGSQKPPTHESIDAREHYIFQDGQPVFKNAVVKMAEVAEAVMQRNDLEGDDIAWLVPHQANLRIIEATRKRANIDPDKVMINIEKYGNTTNATIPLCLWEWEGRLNKGDNLILAAFGGGFTWGASYLKWAY